MPTKTYTYCVAQNFNGAYKILTNESITDKLLPTVSCCSVNQMQVIDKIWFLANFIAVLQLVTDYYSKNYNLL